MKLKMKGIKRKKRAHRVWLAVDVLCGAVLLFSDLFVLSALAPSLGFFFFLLYNSVRTLGCTGKEQHGFLISGVNPGTCLRYLKLGLLL